MVGVIGRPIEVPRDLDRGALQQWVQVVETELLELTRLAEDWAVRMRRDGTAAAPPIIPGREAWRESA